MKYFKISLMILGFCFLTISGIAQSAVKPKVIAICYMSFDKKPYYTLEKTGIDLDLLWLIGKRLEITFEFVAKPWKRCQADMESNDVDGIIGASYNKRRMKQGQYPFKTDGTLDETVALHTDGYSFYKQKGDPLNYDGESFINLTGAIGVNLGFSIGDKLVNRGIVKKTEIDVGAKTTEQNMRKLLAGRIQGFADGRVRGDYFLKTHPEFEARIERIPTPYDESGRHLMFSHGFYKRHKLLADQIWSLVREIKQSDDYKNLLKGHHLLN